MQAASISTALPANTSVPKTASLPAPPPAGQPVSPFAALFQTQFKTANGNVKLPAPGKPKDSARAQDVSTVVSSSPQIPWQQLQAAAFLPVPAAPALPIPVSGAAVGSATPQGPPVATTNAASASSLPAVHASQQSINPWGSGVAPVDLQIQAPVVSPAGTTKDLVTPRDSRVAPANSQNLSSDLPVRTNDSLAFAIPQLVSSMASLDANSGPQAADVVPNPSAPPSLPSTAAPQVQGAANTPQSDSKIAAPNAAGLPYVRDLQAARSGIEFMNLQTTSGAKSPANPPEQIPQSSSTGNASQFGSKVPIGAAATASATPVQAAAGTTAVGVPTSTLHDSLQSQAINSAQSAPNVAAISKPQSKDTSSGSPGNDANTKSEHPLNSIAAHTDGNGFGQSLDPSGANAGNAHAVSTASTAIAADVRVPVEPRAASADAKPDSSSLLSSPHGQSLPTTSAADQPLVSGARLTDHPGQTEIRIEMQAGSLGAVELRAHISGDQIGASIAVEHHDAQIMLTNDLPALHTALAEKNLHFNTVSVSQGMGASMGGGSGSDAGQRGFVPSHPKAVYVTDNEISAPVMDTPAESVYASHAGVRLSVLA